MVRVRWGKRLGGGFRVSSRGLRWSKGLAGGFYVTTGFGGGRRRYSSGGGGAEAMGIIGAILLIGGLYLVGAYGIPAWLILFAITTGLGFLSYKTTVPGESCSSAAALSALFAMLLGFSIGLGVFLSVILALGYLGVVSQLHQPTPPQA
jgi:hypothetical protein